MFYYLFWKLLIWESVVADFFLKLNIDNIFHKIDIVISLVILFYTYYIIWYKNYFKDKSTRDLKISNYGEFLQKRKIHILLYMLWTTIIIPLIFTWGLIIRDYYNILLWLWIEQDWYYRGLAFLYSYDENSVLYGIYNFLTKLVTITGITVLVVMVIIYKIYWDNQNWDRYKFIINAIKINLLIIFLLYTTFPDMIANFLFNKLNNQWGTLYELMNDKKKLNP